MHPVSKWRAVIENDAAHKTLNSYTFAANIFAAHIFMKRPSEEKGG
jgi:hypothetical protein